MLQSAVRLKEPVESCDVSTDIKTIASAGVEHPVSEQLLPDFYAEHTTLAMNKERRRQVNQTWSFLKPNQRCGGGENSREQIKLPRRLNVTKLTSFSLFLMRKYC